MRNLGDIQIRSAEYRNNDEFMKLKHVLLSVTGIVVVVFITLGLLSQRSVSGEVEVEHTQNEDLERPQVVPYSIEAFRQRGYGPTEIVREEMVREAEGFTSYKVSFISDGLKQYALMNIPNEDMPEDGFPVVIVNHGYIDPEDYSTVGDYTNTSSYYANSGFLVLKPDYRGHDESEGQANTVISRISYAADVLNLLAGLEALPEANKAAVFMYGHSMGGDVTLRVLETTDQVKAASLWAPAVTDFPESHLYFARERDLERAVAYKNEVEVEIGEENYDEVSPIIHVSLIKVPVLIHHGTQDESVPIDWGIQLYEELKQVGKEITFFKYSGDNHDLAGNFSLALARDVELFRSQMEN